VRATRDAEAPTVPSRWLLRLENLLDGMGEAGADALAAAKARGRRYLALAQALERSERVPAAPRPSPVLPPGAAPRRLSVTQVETLVRDPYAIYAAHVLRLRRLVPPGQEADALARGTALHAVLDAFIAATEDGLPEDALGLFRAIAEQVLSATPRAAARAIWLARLMRIAPWFLAGEAARRDRARPFAREVRGALEVPALDFTLSARADRIDRTAAGAYAVYDYKSGSIPTEREAGAFHLQLPLEAAMLRRGAFPDVPPGPTEHLEMVGLGGRRVLALDPATAEATLERLGRLLSAYLDEGTGFTARLRPQRIAFGSDYDHLSRYGEWGDGDAPAAIHVG
jgi:RecB family exonuclease